MFQYLIWYMNTANSRIYGQEYADEIAQIPILQLIRRMAEELKKQRLQSWGPEQTDLVPVIPRKMHEGRNKVFLGNKCFSCGEPATKQCVKCKQALYCKKECQRRDWNVHKSNCLQ